MNTTFIGNNNENANNVDFYQYNKCILKRCYIKMSHYKLVFF